MSSTLSTVPSPDDSLLSQYASQYQTPNSYSQNPASGTTSNIYSPAGTSHYSHLSPDTDALFSTTPRLDEDFAGIDFPDFEDVSIDNLVDSESSLSLNLETATTATLQSTLPPEHTKHSPGTATVSGNSYLLSPVSRLTQSPQPPAPMNHVLPNTNTGAKPVSPSIQIPATQMQMERTPDASNSSYGSADGLNPTSCQLLSSPIFKFTQHWGREGSPSVNDYSNQILGQPDRTAPQSTSHLSPHPIDPDDEATDRSGVDPSKRDELNTSEILSVKQMEALRIVGEKNTEVAHWLTHSEAGSDEIEQAPTPPAQYLHKPKSRRRAVTVGDPRAQPLDALHLDMRGKYDDSGIPGPGLLVDEESGPSDDSDDESIEGSHPSTPRLGAENDAVVTDFPHLEDFSKFDDPAYGIRVGQRRHWEDGPHDFLPSNIRTQPSSSAAAIIRWRQMADNMSVVSRAATVGSRRMSTGDIEEAALSIGLMKRLSFGRSKTKDQEGDKDRRLSFFDNALSRKISNKNKRKLSNADKSRQEYSSESHDKPRRDSPPNPVSPIRSPSFPRGPKPDTKSAIAVMAGGLAIVGAGRESVGSTWEQARTRLTQSRSIGRLGGRHGMGNSSGLASLLKTELGGPPVPTLASPHREKAVTRAFAEVDHDDEDEDEDDVINEPAVRMEMKPANVDPIIPTLHGFRENVLQINPRLRSEEYLVERIAREQLQRYRNLLGYKKKHVEEVSARKCSSGGFCFQLGGREQTFKPKGNNREVEGSYAGFQVSGKAGSDEEGSNPGDGTVLPAQFPPGIPEPPVKRLPAEFECSLCFGVKKFQKPSDWTKHVHEDAQPFTCTFPNCSEPKSFKRKADWVRHENERHRKLEWWTCSLPDCNHTCFRRDNFVQHLVREHKMPDPKNKSAKATRKANGRCNVNTGPNDRIEDWKTHIPGGTDDNELGVERVWDLVRDCKGETDKKPQEEPCKFCGNHCASWKKLTVHLARHMEQISLQVLPLVNQANVTADMTVSPVEMKGTRLAASPVAPLKAESSSVSPVQFENVGSHGTMRQMQFAPTTNQGAFHNSEVSPQPQNIGYFSGPHSAFHPHSPHQSHVSGFPSNQGLAQGPAAYSLFDDDPRSLSATSQGYVDGSPSQAYQPYDMIGPHTRPQISTFHPDPTVMTPYTQQQQVPVTYSPPVETGYGFDGTHEMNVRYNQMSFSSVQEGNVPAYMQQQHAHQQNSYSYPES